jgi:transglutaminase-like putative cysteine protease
MVANLPETLNLKARDREGVVYSIHHRMNFSYSGSVARNRNEVRLHPRSDQGQNCEWFELRTDPSGDVIEMEDEFGNRCHHFEIRKPHQTLSVEARTVVSITGAPATQLVAVPLADMAAAELSAAPESARYLAPSLHIPYVQPVEELVVAAEEQSEGSAALFVEAAARLIRSRFRYRLGVTQASSSIVDLLETKSGVCQDFAHLLIAILRWRRVPARYVSGYLIPEYLIDPCYKGDRLFRTEAGHAWVEFLLPFHGWIGVDPTLGITPKLRHVRIACGRDYRDAAPVSGIYQGHPQSRVHSMIQITPLHQRA